MPSPTLHLRIVPPILSTFLPFDGRVVRCVVLAIVITQDEQVIRKYLLVSVSEAPEADCVTPLKVRLRYKIEFELARIFVVILFKWCIVRLLLVWFYIYLSVRYG
jgi:hypothetical protein